MLLVCILVCLVPSYKGMRMGDLETLLSPEGHLYPHITLMLMSVGWFHMVSPRGLYPVQQL
jgi:hypothetical protein